MPNATERLTVRPANRATRGAPAPAPALARHAPARDPLASMGRRLGNGAAARALAPSAAAVQRMLVPIVVDAWPDEKKLTITNRQAALARGQGQQLATAGEIANLGDGEELWLYSHGSPNGFGGMTAGTLAAWLVARMPPGHRKVTLKGCATGSFARAVQTTVRLSPGFEQVTVVGFGGEASQTTSRGEMLIRQNTPSELKKASAQGALAHMKALREGKPKKEADAIRAQVDKQSRTYGAVFDEEQGEYVAEDERTARTNERQRKKRRKDTIVVKDPEPKFDKPPDPDPDGQGIFV
jgi:hypothetical protein